MGVSTCLLRGEKRIHKLCDVILNIKCKNKKRGCLLEMPPAYILHHQVSCPFKNVDDGARGKIQLKRLPRNVKKPFLKYNATWFIVKKTETEIVKILVQNSNNKQYEIIFRDENRKTIGRLKSSKENISNSFIVPSKFIINDSIIHYKIKMFSTKSD